MADVVFPYGKTTLSATIPDERYAGCLASKLHAYVPQKDEYALVREALEHPMGTPRLCQLAKGKRKIVILASDHTRPVPSKILAPLLLQEIRSQNPEAQVTFLIASGCHRRITEEELRGKFGDEIVDRERIVVHDAKDELGLKYIGRLPSGGDLIINRLAAEADLLIAEGFIEPHFFAGFSGGRKSVLPGIASYQTVLYNHNASFIHDLNSRTGVIRDNPIHRDMLYAARAAKLAFICNVVIRPDRRVVYAVAGDAEEAHAEGRRFLNAYCRVSKKPSDIVITTNGGYPLDQNIYQAVKGMTAAEATVKEGGVIIMLAESGDGHGGEGFYETFKKQKDLNQMIQKFLETPPERTIADQWQSQIFARVLLHATVIYLSKAPDSMVRDLHMIPAHTIEEAMEMADKILLEQGIAKGSILAIPDGVSVIVQ